MDEGKRAFVGIVGWLWCLIIICVPEPEPFHHYRLCQIVLMTGRAGINLIHFDQVSLGLEISPLSVWLPHFNALGLDHINSRGSVKPTIKNRFRLVNLVSMHNTTYHAPSLAKFISIKFLPNTTVLQNERGGLSITDLRMYYKHCLNYFDFKTTIKNTIILNHTICCKPVIVLIN